MRIAIFGTGGAGGYFGGRLAQAGEDVIFIARGEHLQAIRTHGLRVESTKGDFVIQPAQATDQPDQVGEVDFILLGVKAWQVTEAASAMRPMVGQKTFVMPIQNGVEAPTQLAEVLGEEHVIGGTAKIASFIAGPGHIRHIGGPGSVAFCELDNRCSDRVQQLQQVYSRARVGAEIAVDIHQMLWEKFVAIVSTGGVSAITRAPLGVIRSVPETRTLLEQAVEEACHVGQAHGVKLSPDLVRRTMEMIDRLEAQSTFSMQRDIMEGRPSELEYWNGAVVRLGRQVGVATPVHTFLYQSLLPQELQARGKIQFAAQRG